MSFVPLYFFLFQIFVQSSWRQKIQYSIVHFGNLVRTKIHSSNCFMFEICSGLGRSQHSKFRLNKKIKKFRGKILIFFFEKTLGLGGLLDMLFAHLLHNNCTTMLICLAFFYKKKKKKKLKMLDTSVLLCKIIVQLTYLFTFMYNSCENQLHPDTSTFNSHDPTQSPPSQPPLPSSSSNLQSFVPENSSSITTKN